MQRSIPACQLSPSSITKMCCFSTFIWWAKVICDSENLNGKIQHLKKTFR
jgi:hypothetical protein